VRAGPAAALVLLAMSGRSAGGQQTGLAPGPGWTAAGAAALLDGGVSPAAGLWGVSAPTLWLAGARPWGVKGISQVEAATAFPVGPGAVALWRRQVIGDGLVRSATGLVLSRTVAGDRLAVSLRLGEHRLGAAGERAVTDPIWGVGLVGRATGLEAGVRWIRPLSRRLVTGSCDWAVGAHEGRWWLRLAGRTEFGHVGRTGLVLAYGDARFRCQGGGWGHPLQPLAGVRLRAGGVRVDLAGRWAPGLGLHLQCGLRWGPGGEG